MEHVLQNYIIEFFRHQLDDRSMSHRDFANQLSITRQTLSKYFTQRTELSVNMFERFCTVLGIQPGTVLSQFDLMGIPTGDIAEDPRITYRRIKRNLSGIVDAKPQPPDEVTKLLREQVDMLKSQLADKNRLIAMLEEKAK